MTRKTYRYAAVMLAAAIVLSLSIFAHEYAESNAETTSANEQMLVEKVCKDVVDSYAEYYTIPQISGVITEREQVIGGTNYTIEVNFTKVLLAKDAAELPYIQGMAAEISAMADSEQRIAAQAKLDVRMRELNALYIGVEQPETSSFRVFVPVIGMRSVASVEVFFADDFGEMPMEEFAPQTEEELYKAGTEEVASVVGVCTVNNATTEKTNPSDVEDYDRLLARDYVRAYSCGNCGMNSHSCANTNYNFYSRTDCANFVSQAINYAGISTESNWKPYTITWINTGYSDSYYGLVEYMEDQGFFFEETNKNKAFAGSIICWTEYSHVGMVSANDTVTMTYCAHTSDRKDASFRNWTGTSDDTSVKFYVPVWDSYADDYTVR